VSVLFKPQAWGAHALLLVGLAISIAAGLWQYGTYSDDRADAARSLVDAEPVALSSLMGGDSPFPGDSVGQPVRLTGTWLPEGTVYVSGQYHDKVRGYWVVTPVVIGKSAIPVVRGWSAKPSAPQPSASPVTLTGWLEPSEAQGEADADPHDDVITSMRIPSITQHVDVDLYSAYVVEKPFPGEGGATMPGGLAPVGPTHHPDVSGFTGLRNLLYALQWWVFGILALYIWWRWCQEQLHPRESDVGSGTGPETGPTEQSEEDRKVPSSP